MNLVCCALGLFLFAVEPPPAVSVDGRALSSAEWEFLRLTRVDEGQPLTPELRERLIDQAIERQLIRTFLARRKLTPRAELLDLEIHQLEDRIRRGGKEPDKLFASLGLSSERLRQELGLWLAWQAHVQQAASDRILQQHFAEHRVELDGTRVRVRQIFRKAAKDAPVTDVAVAEQLLTKLKGDIESKRITFEAAAKEHSQSPSADQGGDVGLVGAPGKLPDELTVAALKLSPGELAGPLRTPFGVHLIQVTERQPGQLSLEDARPQILERLSAQWWQETVAKERAMAKIVRPK